VILVDTHAVIWMTQEPAILSDEAACVLLAARRTGELAIADITLREIAHLVARKRVRVSTPLDIYLDFVESVFRVLPMDSKIARRSVEFGPKYPNDPIDQIIGATAVVLKATLVTKDQAIRASGEVDCVW
jgi:PIN domain nuclease of toxin-antitoxin system